MDNSSARTVYVGIVEDDESARRSLGRLLRAAGMQPIGYASGEEFLADAQQPPFACLVLDVQLLGMSGLDLQRQLAAAGVTTPVFFITAQDDPQVREQAMAAGCLGFFRKTDAGSALLDAIRRVA